ncbi:MAG: hypothetical protein FJW22_15855 [Acidimicrobiia bacterium]|nr:hypothetical protein [Acidimicrobiia bacterium]
MNLSTTVQTAVLLAATGLSVWAAIVAQTRRAAPGAAAFGWLVSAVAPWSLTSAIHTLIDDYEAGAAMKPNGTPSNGACRNSSGAKA